MTTQKHAPLPWKYFEKGSKEIWTVDANTKRIVPEIDKANAEFIVAACNNHYKLVESIRKVESKLPLGWKKKTLQEALASLEEKG